VLDIHYCLFGIEVSQQWVYMPLISLYGVSHQEDNHVLIHSIA